MRQWLLKDAQLATMRGGYGMIRDGAVAIDGGEIAWVGAMADCPAQFLDREVVSAEGRLITPGLIDCHTHLVHGGQRAHEFELRLKGASYQQIAREGGGIVATVADTRAASEEELVCSALARLDALLAEGVTTVEIKSGYGLDTQTELAMLRAARRLPEQRRVAVKTSFLGAHAVPVDMGAEAYIDTVCIPALRQAHALGLVDAVDGFCEGIAFGINQIGRIFNVAHELGLPIKLHAEQLSHQGGTALAARYGAMSVDHVEYATDADAAALAKSGTVAVVLPGAFYTLRETQAPPIDAFRAHGVPMAVATDLNPGSSPLNSLLLAMNMACTLFRLTPEEALLGVTAHAARALGLKDRGVIAAGYRADLVVWDIGDPAELSYRIGFNPLKQRIFAGEMA